MTPTTLVTGTTAALREAAIAAVLASAERTALILEGLPDGASRLEQAPGFANLQVARIAPGCLCCIGNLTLRVTLNRILRRPPERLYIALATSAHLAQMRAFLTQPPYDKLLQLTKDLHG